jgi:hypothetical protein
MMHAQLDRAELARPSAERAANARKLVYAHHVLARQQLVEATALFVESRTAMGPAFDHMARLARDAEQRNASAAERVQAYALFKSYIEHLLTINRFAIEDAGFWAGVRMPTTLGAGNSSSATSLYEFSLIPEIDLRATGEAPPMSAPYPAGRERRIGVSPGIR